MLTESKRHAATLAVAESQGTALPEWLITNGRGGFASGTVNQTLTRRYHGLLVAAVEPPVKRYLLLAKLDATVFIGGHRFELDTNEYHDARHPQGYQYLIHFEAAPRPTWRWRLGNTILEQRIEMIDGVDATRVQYRVLQGESPVDIALRPLCTCRHFHHLTDAGGQGNPFLQPSDHCIYLEWDDELPAWLIEHDGMFELQTDWYYGFQLAWERQRGYDYEQDLFSPGLIRKQLLPNNGGLNLLARTRDAQSTGPLALRIEDANRDVDEPGDGDEFVAALTRTAAQFVVRRESDLRTVIAGYPWFGDWGRDTFIALPGLCLVTGRFDDARRIIEMFSKTIDRGMIPNRFPPYGEPPQYNTCDATLWYVHAIGRYLDYTDDWAFVERVCWPALLQIITQHLDGTSHGIVVDADGLIKAGEPGFALTWMDAKLGDRVFTPRIGKPVEINALWYNALRYAAKIAQRVGNSVAADQWSAAADKNHAAFNARFWNDETGCLFDVVEDDGRPQDHCGKIRPNQLFAISLPHAVLEPSRRASVIKVCRERLLTPMGLRTLAPNDPSYIGNYAGTLDARDAAYHQGTVWPWLLGPFISAWITTEGASAVPAARDSLQGLRAHLSQNGLNGISEVANGDPPHLPEGCPWQAWSVAEVLRVLREDLSGR